MDSDTLIAGIVSLVITGVIGFFALDLFEGLVSSSLALEPGDPYYETQRSLLPTVASHLHWFVGGIGLMLTALAGLVVLGQGR